MKHSIAPQRLNVVFDDDSLVANSGMLPAAVLLQRLGVRELADIRLSLGSAPANPNRGDKLLTLICSALTGGDCIDDANVLRAGDTARILGFKVKASSTLGTFPSRISLAQRTPAGRYRPYCSQARLGDGCRSR